MQGGESIRVMHPLFHGDEGGSIPTSPLQLDVGRIEMKVAIPLNDKWHSRLPAFTSPPERCMAYGAAHGGIFYAVAIWSPPLARMLNHTGRYELRRFAIAPDAPRNTASRVLRVMALLLAKERPDVDTLISYQDTAVHSGTIYKAAGWSPVLRSTGGEWIRARGSIKAQSAAPKVRWELRLRQTQNEIRSSDDGR